MKKINLKPSRVFRGGGWLYYASFLCAAYRDSSIPSSQISSFDARLSLRFTRGKR
jgi:hypothetical protein